MEPVRRPTTLRASREPHREGLARREGVGVGGTASAGERSWGGTTPPNHIHVSRLRLCQDVPPTFQTALVRLVDRTANEVHDHLVLDGVGWSVGVVEGCP